MKKDVYKDAIKDLTKLSSRIEYRVKEYRIRVKVVTENDDLNV